MIDATVLCGVVGDCAAGSAELVVEGDAGCEREQADGDAGEEVAWAAGAVAFEGEEVFAGPEDGLDSLPDGGEVRERCANSVHAAAWDSWMIPPSRSWRSTKAVDGSSSRSLRAAGSGGLRLSDRCGLWLL